MQAFDKVIGLVFVLSVFYYLFKDQSTTSSIVNAGSTAFDNAVKTLQGRS